MRLEAGRTEESELHPISIGTKTINGGSNGIVFRELFSD